MKKFNPFTSIAEDHLLSGRAWERCEKFIDDHIDPSSPLDYGEIYNLSSQIFEEIYEDFKTAANTLDDDIAMMASEMIDEIFDSGISQINFDSLLDAITEKYMTLHSEQTLRPVQK